MLVHNVPYEFQMCAVKTFVFLVIVLCQVHTMNPNVTPKHSQLSKILGGIAHVVTLGIPYAFGAKWPGFFNSDEICPACNMPPGASGCRKVLQQCELHIKGKTVMVTVDHTSQIDRVCRAPGPGQEQSQV